MAGSPGGEVIGRVSVKVLPDTSEFKDKLQRKLKKDAATDVQVKVFAEIDKKSLQKIKDDLRDWQRHNSPIKIKVKPELANGSLPWINERLRYATRPRTVPIYAYVVPGSIRKATAQIGTMMAALSGGRALKEIVGDFTDWLRTLDKAAPKMALIVQGLTGIVGLGLTAGSNLFAMSSALASIGAVVLTMPATFASAAIGLGILIAAFKDFNTVLPGVKQKLSELQNIISSSFWKEAKAPFQEMISTLFPAFSAGLKTVSGSLGGFVGALATGLSTALAPTVGGMFTQLSDAINIAGGAMAPLTQAMATFGEMGAAYLPRMAQWITDSATRFNTWLTNAKNDGSFQQWVDNGLAALSDLGQVLKNVSSILSSIANAATLAGGSSLGMMADTLQKVADAAKSPAFQGPLVATLRAAHDAMASIGTTAGPAFGKFMETLASTLTNLLPVAGSAIGSLVASLATALSNPAFVTGFSNFIAGAADMIARLGPALTPIAGMLGALGSVLGQFMGNVASAIAPILSTLAGALQTLLPTLQPLISILSGALAGAFQALAPVIQLIATAAAQLVTALGPVLTQVFAALMPVVAALVPVFASLVNNLMTALLPLLPILAGAITQIAPLFAQLIGAVAPLVGAILPPLAAILGAIIPVIVMIAQAVLPPLIEAVTALVTALMPVITVVAQIVTWLIGILAPVITFIAGLLVGIVTSLLNGFTNIFEGIMQIWEGFKTMFSGGWSGFLRGLVMILQGIWNVIIGVVEVALNIGVLGVAKKGFTALKGLFKLAWDGIKAGAQIAWAFIKGAFRVFMNDLKAAPGQALASIKALFKAAWDHVLFGIRFAFGQVLLTVSGKLGEVVGLLRGLPGKCVAALGAIGTALSGAGQKLIQGFIDGIGAMFKNVKGKLQDLTHKLTDWKGPESLDRVLLVEAGQLIIQGLINGMESRYDGVRRSLQGLTSDIGATVIASPQMPDLSGSYAAVNSALAGGGPGSTGTAPYAPSISVQMESNADPEDVADAILFAQKRVAYGSAYGY